MAAKNREGKLNPEEEPELNNYIRVGQTLGVLPSKARRRGRVLELRTSFLTVRILRTNHEEYDKGKWKTDCGCA